ncbi:hypothetical protein ACQKNX_22865 [Lysinibacillus sp. NPDC093712]|uniref:hypothetical protein n=1 Tax=Lysinibacillus sp. NPDC093712 TaxID=3390579 RepID=UPI003D018FF6
MRKQKSIEDGMGQLCRKKSEEEAAYLEFLKNQMTIFDSEFNLNEHNQQGGDEIEAIKLI